MHSFMLAWAVFLIALAQLAERVAGRAAAPPVKLNPYNRHWVDGEGASAGGPGPSRPPQSSHTPSSAVP